MLQIEDLNVHYGRAEAIKGVSLSVDDGMIVTLIGANGAGKTTILRTISGLKLPTSGQIRFREKRIDGMPAYEIVKVGIAHVPEGRIVFAPMTVLDNLKMGAFLRHDKESIIRDFEIIYEHFPILESRRTQLAGSLSGGEQQMLAMARALMASPRLMLMDEPSMGLSPLMVKEIGRIIQDINQRGVGIFLVEQNARMALKLAEKAYVIEIGKIALEGSAQDIGLNEDVKKAYLGV